MYNIDLIVHNYANYAKCTLTDRFLNELYKAIILAIQLYSIQLIMQLYIVLLCYSKLHNYAVIHIFVV